MLKTPVLFIIFNRPDTTRLAFETIKRAKPLQLFVAADGPRKDNLEDFENCKNSRDIIKIDWDCELKTLYHESNLGCGMGPATAISWFFKNVTQGIILEDDCIPGEDFFLFCQELLNKYETNEKVFNICGCNLGFNPTINGSYFFSKFMNMSGWATWKRTAQNIDYSLTYWSDLKKNKFRLYKKLRYYFFDFDYYWINLWDKKIRETLMSDKVTWWDYQWILNQLQKEMVSIIPAKNMVKNVGFNDRATHTKSADHPIAFIETQNLNWPLIHPQKLELLIEYEEQFIKKKWLGHSRVSIPKILLVKLKVRIKFIITELVALLGYEISIRKKNR